MNTVRPADVGDLADVARVLEGALLDVPVSLEAACAEGRVLVAGEPIFGVAVVAPSVAGARLVGLAVTPSRRGEGIARALVTAALARWHPLTATLDERVRPVYDALDFALYPVSADRYRAVRR
jgi:GNAT superfamily N-acetyltransferase